MEYFYGIFLWNISAKYFGKKLYKKYKPSLVDNNETYIYVHILLVQLPYMSYIYLTDLPYCQKGLQKLGYSKLLAFTFKAKSK